MVPSIDTQRVGVLERDNFQSMKLITQTNFSKYSPQCAGLSARKFFASDVLTYCYKKNCHFIHAQHNMMESMSNLYNFMSVSQLILCKNVEFPGVFIWLKSTAG